MSSLSKETKLPDMQPQLQTVQWFWQSDPDPWQYKDPAEWNWKAYSYDQSESIEEAYLSDQKVVDLGAYEVDLKKELQINKADRKKFRRVKRVINALRRSRFMEEMPNLYVIDKPQKTIHAAFGNVQHFLNYIMKRTPEANRLYHRLKELSLDAQLTEYTDVVTEVTACIQKGGECREKMIAMRKNSFVLEAKEIIEDIEKKSNPELKLKDFFKMILKIYTMESFICYWLNELLRSEHWEEINVLTPYLVCLTYAFQVQDYVIKYQEPQGFRETLKGFFKSKKLYLYRGTTLVKAHLNSYHPGNTRFFSWNGVTSTSRSKEQAERFIRHSMKNGISGEKIGVLFIIEVDFESAADCEGMIDVSQDSNYPHEQEVIIAPGTVFEVMNFVLNKVENKAEKKVEFRYEIKLRLVKKFKNNQKLVGDFHEKILSDDKVVLKNMDSEEIMKALQLLEGNQVAEKLEIENCRISTHLVKQIDSMRKTTKIKKENIVLKNSDVEIDALLTLCHYFSWENFIPICTANKISFDKYTRQTTNMRELSIDQDIFKIFFEKNRILELSDTIKTEKHIANLNLVLKDLQIPEAELSALVASTGSLTNLQSLALDFGSNKAVSTQMLDHLQQAMQSWKFIKQLTLNFSYCSNLVHNKGEEQSSSSIVNNLMGTLKILQSLQHLSLDFKDCKLISDESLNMLADALKVSISLQNLSLSLGDNKEISDKSLANLTDALMMLPLLKNISLDINDCQVSDQSSSSLSNALKSLNSLEWLSVDFSGSKQRANNDGVLNKTEILKVDMPLQQVSLSLRDCKQGSKQTLPNLKNVLTSFKSLAHLSLKFRDFYQLPGQGLNSLFDALQVFTSLHHLFIDFSDCQEISAQDFSSLANSLKPLKTLKHLSLDFTNCIEISDQDLNQLKDAIKEMISLEHLSLDFGYWRSLQIADQGQNSLTDPVKISPQLQHLFIDFGNSKPLSQQSVNLLVSSIQSLPALKHLSVDMRDCKQISAQSVVSLSETLKLLKLLQHISVDFFGCSQISDQGLNSLNNAIKPLVSLQHLALNFWGYEKISP